MTSGAGAVLVCHHLSKRFAGQVAIDELDLSVPPGEVVALIGFNGAGKTTLMRLVLAMTRPDSGETRIFGHTVETARREQWRRVGQMIETPFAYPELTTAENLWAAARLHGLPRAQAPHAVRNVIERLDLGAYRHRRASVLSQGNRQRLGLASALVHSPALLILDEPTNALDPAGVVLLRDVVKEASSAGTAVLVSSHHLDEVARVADRVVVIHGGRVVGELPPDTPDLEHAFFAMVHTADNRAPQSAGRPDEA